MFVKNKQIVNYVINWARLQLIIGILQPHIYCTLYDILNIQSHATRV